MLFYQQLGVRRGMCSLDSCSAPYSSHKGGIAMGEPKAIILCIDDDGAGLEARKDELSCVDAFLSKGESWSTVVSTLDWLLNLRFHFLFVGRLQTPKPINPGPQG